MTTANNPNNNLSPWKPGHSGNPSGRPRGTRDLAGYVLETTGGGMELVNALLSMARGVTPNIPVQEGSRARKDQQVRPADQLKAIEMLLDRGFGRSPQQLDIAHSVTDRPMEHLSDETLRLLVENALGMLVSRSRWICIPIAFQAFRKQPPYSSIRRWNRPNLLLLR